MLEMSEVSLDKQIDFRIGLNDVSYLERGFVEPKLPEKTAMSFTSEPIASHLDALWKQFSGPTFIVKVCSLSEEDMNLALSAGSYNVATNSLSWFDHHRDRVAPELAARARDVLEELASMEIELQINRKLLVQP